jgi:predicted Zn-dependent protease
MEAYGTASWLMDSNRRKAEAEALLRKGVRAAPEDWVAWDNLGMLLFGAKRYPEAAAAFTRAVARPDCHPKVRHMLGHAHRLAGDLRQSLAAWEAAKKRDPNDPVVENNLRKVRELLRGGR